MLDKKQKLYLPQLGNTIKSYRNKHKISQEKLADSAGLHRTYIGMIERGEKNPSFLALISISNALNITINELLKEFDK